uniref:Kinesin-like protein n=1 Tax=Diabrotica virgifera virgifera TaxID=50390 RepID=A0A6P7GZF8_DIAVI
VTMSYLEIYNEQIRDLLNPSSGFLELREDSKGKSMQVAGLSEVSTNSTDEVTMSYLEIYNEQIRDLLNPSSGFLELREDSKGKSMQVAGLSEVSTNSTDEIMQLLHKGNKARTIEPTAMNQTSSRSHALLSVTVRHTIPVNKTDHLRIKIRQGRLFMIDLAGSERANKTKNSGKRLQEGAHINRSLLALGNCINALSGGARYVNYRDSKLTRLLKDALCGNCKTVMIAHVSPSAGQKEESRNTLIYADRANNITTKIERNVFDVSYHVTQYQTVINELRDEISRLQHKMKEERPRSADVKKLNAEERRNELRYVSFASRRKTIVYMVQTYLELPFLDRTGGLGGSGGNFLLKLCLDTGCPISLSILESPESADEGGEMPLASLLLKSAVGSLLRLPTADLSSSDASGISPPSSADSGDSSIDRLMGQPVSRHSFSKKLPPLPPSPPVRSRKGSS